MSESPALVWLRNDLRLTDNPALRAAAARKGSVAVVYVLDEESDGVRPLGGASRWWLHHSLTALDASLRKVGGALILRHGPAGRVVPALAEEIGARAAFWNRRYEPAEVAVDKSVKAALAENGVNAESFGGNLLHEPWRVETGGGTPFRVFTPFWKAALSAGEPRNPDPAPDRLPAVSPAPRGDRLDDWGLAPRGPDWSGGLADTWQPGEAGAAARLEAFLDDALDGYARARDRPDRVATSLLSPHLRFGEISPFRVWHAARSRGDTRDVEKFLAELGWREFSYHLMFHNPGLGQRNFNEKFDAFPWRDDERALRAWQAGQTGYPIVDAGMRQLWRTGWMHNRVRMVVASFLVKDLMIDWRAGETWFWDTLVDADPANNTASWQWVAGSGADAAPFFRIFNPVLQGEKFDPEGAYVRQWVPEIAALPDRYLHKPWEAPASVLGEAGIKPGETYPGPLVDHATARKRALAAFRSLPETG